MPALLDLTVSLSPPPADASPATLARVDLRCEALGLSAPQGLLEDPLEPAERDDLRWYLEEFWRWPYEGFAERGQRVEGLLADVGRRLYQRVLGPPAAAGLVQAWRLVPGVQRQVSVVGEAAAALALPWELLHDEQGFLALRAQPVSILRRLPQREAASLPVSFTPPLRVLLVTARPEGAGFFDPRSVARELVDEVHEQVEQGTIEVEFLRPPTLRRLRERLRDQTRPVHVLHFDGHGIFQTGALAGVGHGLLAFENADGETDAVAADDLAQVLQDSGVRLAVLTACQTALGAPTDVFSSTAASLIRGGLDGVAAMGASVLVVTATRYAEAFYRALAEGQPAPIAHEYARQALHDDATRHPFRRRCDEEASPVRMRDWWLPQLYQQRALALRPAAHPDAPAPQPPVLTDVPSAPRYGFSGRANELLRVERWLLGQRLVVIRGFGGMGKTALARELADWLTRTGLYRGACFVSFEAGGGAPQLLSALGRHLEITAGDFTPDDPARALSHIRAALRARPTLVIADNLETILTGGDAELDPAGRGELWDVLLALVETPGAGVLATTRDATFGDGRMAGSARVVHLPLEGLEREDAYALATHVLNDLGIDRRRVPYADLRDLLADLDHHPLAIQLVLPVLRELSPATVRTQFAELLPRFSDDTATGRNRSLQASLEYSLRRLSPAHRELLPRLAVFEGGASEDDLLAITEIPDAEWATLRPALEHAALLVPELVPGINVPFLRFHPVLVPFLRAQSAPDTALRERYVQRYLLVATFLYDQDSRQPHAVRALARRELPNFRQATLMLLDQGNLDDAVTLFTRMERFLVSFGLTRERDDLYQRIATARDARATGSPSDADHGFTDAEYLQAYSAAKAELERGDLAHALAHFEHLLGQIKAAPAGAPRGPGSYEHAIILTQVGRCLMDARHSQQAETHIREALALLDDLLRRKPDDRNSARLRAHTLSDLADALHDEGRYTEARTIYVEALGAAEQLGDLRAQAVANGQLGSLAVAEQRYDEARQRFTRARMDFEQLGEPTNVAASWQHLGRVAQRRGEWREAERCYRQSLAIWEQLDNRLDCARTRNQLGVLLRLSGRLDEAETWYRRALNTPGVPPEVESSVRSNLAALLLALARAQPEPRTRLEEARQQAAQALAVKQSLDLSAEPWLTQGILADIAALQGGADEALQLRRQEHESFAAFAGNRHKIERIAGGLIAELATAQGDQRLQARMRQRLPELEAKGWLITTAVEQIWAGERDWHALAASLDRHSALLVLRVLETIAETERRRPALPRTP